MSVSCDGTEIRAEELVSWIFYHLSSYLKEPRRSTLRNVSDFIMKSMVKLLRALWSRIRDRFGGFEALQSPSLKEWGVSQAASIIRLLPPETAHDAGLWCLSHPKFQSLVPVTGATRLDLSMQVPGLGRIRHPVGLAAGFDKNAVAVQSLSRLGFWGIEIGTVTSRPQTGHPKPRMFRYPDTQDIINRMGFPSDGADAVAQRLAGWSPAQTYLGINVGKNYDTPLDGAMDDYLECLSKLIQWGDYYVVNISSPNTPGLRDLANPSFFKDLAVRLPHLEAGLTKKVWIKCDPHMSKSEFQALVHVITTESFGGLILTNTRRVEYPQKGGLSGHSLRSHSLQRLIWAKEVCGDHLGIISCGGVSSGEDVLESIRLGAHAVSLYSAMVYRGPLVVQKIISEIEGRMESESVSCLEDLQSRS